ncbi:MAG: zinc-binding dehydrogenase [Flavobacteriales bacterium]|nr:zinc-binding dehydrogenase [Flavobacteriales bacterium]
MRAWTLTAHGAPEQVLRIERHDLPRPGSGQVRIKCEGFGLNYADVMAVRGLYREAPPLPSILGYEVVGVVDELGDGVPGSLLGARVAALTRFGGYAEYALTDHRALIVIPADLPLGLAASMTTQGCTAWYAARILCPLRKGERVLIHAAAGGVGQWLVQLALRSGCEVFAIAGGPVKAARLRSLGVQHVIDRHAGDPHLAVRDRLGDLRLDVSFNAVGGSSFKADGRLLGAGGRIVLYGGSQRMAAGPFGTLRFVWSMGLTVPIFLMMRGQSILGINMLRIAEHHPDLVAASLEGIKAAYDAGGIDVHVHGTFAIERLPEALHTLASGASMGKIVVRW